MIEHASKLSGRSLLFVIYGMQMGGAERQFSIMANNLARRGASVTIACWEDFAEPYYQLDPRVKFLPMGGWEHGSGASLDGLKRNRDRIRRLRQAIKDIKPQAIVSFGHRNNIRALLATQDQRHIPVFVMEASDPFREPLETSWKWLRAKLYPDAGGVVLQTKHVLSYFANDVQNVSHVIPNPIKAPQHMRIPGTHYRVVTLGRLDHVKGFDLLIEAFAKVEKEFPQWNLVLNGDGVELENLTAQAKNLGLSNRVEFPGATKTPDAELSKGDFFVLSSRREGFPNALCEAMAVGLPALAFKCPYGPETIIREGVDGMLVPPEDVDALAEGLRKLMSDEGLRNKLGEQAAKILDRFGEDAVMDQWENLIVTKLK